MSAQSRQSAAPASAAAPAPSTRAGPSPSAGNAAAAASAGLPAQAPPDASLAGPFAGLLLDVMPLADALEAGLPHLANPAVRQWLAALPPEAVAASLEGRPGLLGGLLDRALPAGIGLQAAAELGGGLVGGMSLSTECTLWHDGGGLARVTASPAARLELGGGVGGGLTDAFGGGVEAKAGAELSVTAQLDLCGQAALSLGEWAAALGLGLPEAWRRIVVGDPPPAALDLEAVRPLLAVDLDAAITTAAEATARGRVDDPEALPPALRALVDGALGGPAGGAHALVEGVAGVTATWSALDDGLLRLRLEAAGHLLAEAAADLGARLPGLDAASLDLAGRAAAEAACALELSLAPAPLPGLAPTLFSVAFELTRGEAAGATEAQTTLRFEGLRAAADGLRCGAPGRPQPLAEVLPALPSLARTVRLTLDPARLTAALPDWMTLLPGLPEACAESGQGLISSTAELALEGRQALEPAAAAAAAEAGLTLPAGTRPSAAAPLLADGVLAVQAGQPAPPQLAGQEAALAAATDGHLGQARLVGRLARGVGGAASGAALAEASGTAAASAGIVVDQPADRHLAELLAAALGG